MAAEGGPAEYLFQNPKYHDCYLTVGDPATGDVEKIGVSVRHLAAHSTVFRHLLVDSDLADPTGENTKITDVTPEVFNLMLIHVYGGQLPTVSRDVAAKLLMCADKYNIKQLVSLTCGLLKPESVDQVFPALICVAHITVPDLEDSVQKIVQEQTDLIINHKQFLRLDENSLEYITKQDKLAVTEVELWKALVKWSLEQGLEGSELRLILKKSLQHVRFLSFTQDEFLKEVLSKNILASEETVNVLRAITTDVCLESPGLCTSKTKRTFKKEKVSKERKETSISVTSKAAPLNHVQSVSLQSYNFPCEYYAGTVSDRKYILKDECQKRSHFILTVGHKDLEVVSFTFMTRASKIVNYDESKPNYKLTCDITVVKLKNNAVCSNEIEHIKFEELVILNRTLDMPVKVKERNLILKANTTYHFELNLSDAHPVHRTGCGNSQETTFTERSHGSNFKLKFTSPIHVTNIVYNV